MSEHDPLDSEVVICPHCHAPNHPNVVICNSCGVRIDKYHAFKKDWLDRQAEAIKIHQTHLKEVADSQVKEAAALNLKEFRKQIKWVLIIGIIAAVLIIVVILINNWMQAKKIETINVFYSQGESCLALKDLVCAREEYTNVLQLDPNFKDTRLKLVSVHTQLAGVYLMDGNTLLALKEFEHALELRTGDPILVNAVNDTRLLLAGQYENLTNWEEAIFMLELVSRDRPGDQDLIQRIKNDYDNWINELRDQKKWLQAIRIENKKESFYP